MVAAAQNLRLVILIDVDKLNNLLVSPQMILSSILCQKLYHKEKAFQHLVEDSHFVQMRH